MNGDSGLLVQFLLALGAVLFLIVVIAWLLKKVNLVSSRVGRLGEDARLSVSEAVAVDHRRKLVLVKRDHVEHLILIGGENDLLLEHAIPPHARPQPKAPSQTQPQKAKQAQPISKSSQEQATKAAVSGTDQEVSKNKLGSKVERLASPVSAAMSALSSKPDKAVKAKPSKSGGSSRSEIPGNELSTPPLSSQTAQTPAPTPASGMEHKNPPQTTQSDIVANWRPERPQPRPAHPSTDTMPVEKMDMPHIQKGPIVPPPAPVPAQPSQQASIQPAPAPQPKAPQPPQHTQPSEGIQARPEQAESESERKSGDEATQQKSNDEQAQETNYQDEITRLLDELSNDSNKS